MQSREQINERIALLNEKGFMPKEIDLEIAKRSNEFLKIKKRLELEEIAEINKIKNYFKQEIEKEHQNQLIDINHMITLVEQEIVKKELEKPLLKKCGSLQSYKETPLEVYIICLG